jgi:membrane-associated phospholipid phosphatase
VEQLTIDTGLTVGTALLLKQFVREQRPDKSDFHSFPSDTAALAFAPAAYLWDRYGWEYGAPAYLLAGYVGYERVDSKQHHWWDVAASAAIGWTYSRLITTRWRQDRFQTTFYATPDGAYVNVNYRW